jgi:hypothetical protein
MISYENIKEKLFENKTKVIYGLCLILMFGVGFGTGKTQKIKPNESKQTKSYTNTNTKPVETKEPAETDKKESPKNNTNETPATTTNSLDPATCTKIKGNISASGGRIYHISGGASYKQVKAEMCFASQAEAEAAGFRKAAR